MPSSRPMPQGPGILSSPIPHPFLGALQEWVAQCCSSSLLLTGAYSWAQTTLKLHAKDKRPFLYKLQELEQGTTHDTLWNAAQVVSSVSPS